MNVIPLHRSTAALPVLACLVFGLFFVGPARAESHDPNWGASLHADNCAGCHKTPHNAAFYQSRKGKMHKNRTSLFTKVQACSNHFNIAWFDEEVDAVTNYLNAKYYKYD